MRCTSSARSYFTHSFIFLEFFLYIRNTYFQEHLKVFVVVVFFDCNLSNKNLLSLFLYFFKKSDVLYLFFTKWLLLIVIDKFAVIEFAILIRSLSLLLPSSTLAEHIYRVSLIPRKGIFQIFAGWLLLLLLFWFTSLCHRYYGEGFPHNLKEAIKDRRKLGKKNKKKYNATAIYSGHCVWCYEKGNL